VRRRNMREVRRCQNGELSSGRGRLDIHLRLDSAVLAASSSRHDPLLAKVDPPRPARGPTHIKLRMVLPRVTLGAPLVIPVLARMWYGPFWSTGSSVAVLRLPRFDGQS